MATRPLPQNTALPLRRMAVATTPVSLRLTMSIKRVWIEDGCISCSLCSDLVPEVFSVENGEPCMIKPDAAKAFADKSDEIREAADDCPVEVIKIETGGDVD